MTNPIPLSPAAQAVLQAFDYERDGEYIDGEWVVNERAMLAAALRAAAEQCKIEWNYHPDYPETEWVVVASDLTAIANELEVGAMNTMADTDWITDRPLHSPS